MHRVKYFVHQDVLQDTMIYAKRFETIQEIEDYDIGLYGIMETQEGDVLFEIDFKYDGEPFVWKRFMHLKSFLGFYRYRKMRFLDTQSEKYIKDYIENNFTKHEILDSKGFE